MIEEYDDAAILQIIKLKLLESPGVKKVKDELSTILRKWDYLADWVVVELKQHNNYEDFSKLMADFKNGRKVVSVTMLPELYDGFCSTAKALTFQSVCGAAI